MKKSLYLGILLLATLFLGCPQNYVQTPGGTSKGSYETEYISAWGEPQNVKATCGFKGYIKLSWSKVSNASMYYVYASDTPYGNYKKVANVKDGKTEYVDTQNIQAGTDRYYRISARTAMGKESDKSEKVRGTTLVCTYINEITNGSDGTST